MLGILNLQGWWIKFISVNHILSNLCQRESQYILFWLACRHGYVCASGRVMAPSLSIPFQPSHQSDAVPTHSHPAHFFLVDSMLTYAPTGLKSSLFGDHIPGIYHWRSNGVCRVCNRHGPSPVGRKICQTLFFSGRKPQISRKPFSCQHVSRYHG